MNYIVFDLEWNQSPYGKAHEIERLPFEIIEIGAVKLDTEREIVDTFQVVVRPTVYRRLNYRTREIVGMNQKDLEKGEWFPDAVRRFLAWSGPDSVFCTWGTVDLPELQRNMKYYDLLSLLKGPMHYYDVQKIKRMNYYFDDTDFKLVKDDTFNALKKIEDKRERKVERKVHI